MKRFRRILMAAMLIMAVTAPAALAWEFGLEGKWLWGIDYFAQDGHNGFFGAYNFASPTGFAAGNPHYAGYNGWMGARTINGLQYGFSMGNDAYVQWSRMEFYPEIRLNQAVRFRGLYEIGGDATTLGNPAAGPFLNRYSLYVNTNSYGWANGIAFGKWNQWWLTAQLPLGIMVIGKRPAPFGIGVQYEGTNATSESLTFVAPYGPLRIGVFCYPWRRASWLNPSVAIATLGPGPIFAAGTLNRQINVSGVALAPPLGATAAIQDPRDWDHEQVRNLQGGLFFTYSSGDVELGALYEWWSQHSSPAEAATNAFVPQISTIDQVAEDGSIFFKYFNGRFFFSTELAWLRGQLNYTPPLTPGVGIAPPLFYGAGAGSEYAPYYNEAWKVAVEMGVVSGPAKVSLLYSWVPGPDRQQGVWIGKQSWENVLGGAFLGNTQLYLPYSLLLSYQYGGGLNAINQRGEGFMTDASSFGGRVDYSVAANLNVYGTFFYANRVSKGWGWGSLVPVAGRSVALLGGAAFLAQPAASINVWGAGSPSIPDDSLGWEVGLGSDWKLLEGITFSTRVAYWNVGNWFKYACVDKNFVTFNTAQAVPLVGDGPFGWGVSPGRALDPILGFQGTVTVDF